MSTIIDTLITDRTQADVDRVFALKLKILTNGLASLTDAENAEYMGGMRGAYNYTDMNRVGAAVAYLAERLTLIDKYPAVNPKTDWAMGDVPTQSDAAAYLADLLALTEVVTLPPDAPFVPETLDRLTYQTANDIEQILILVDDVIGRTVDAFEYSGLAYSGL